MPAEASPPHGWFSVSASLVITIFNFKIMFKTLLEKTLEHGQVENKTALAGARERGRNGQGGLSHLLLFGELISKVL